MLKLKNIHKDYILGQITVKALNDVSLDFNHNEFVAILGPSGCGKTTLLNIIGGLDRYTRGDLIINGKSTKNFSEQEWDSYRNNSIGFVFQQYNLIQHLNVFENVELALTLSGLGESKRKQKTEEALSKVGLSDQLYKKPNQLSGGQMQRVAIARALVNDPDIILADEPTGALDSITSEQIMRILQELSKERLIIMVTHNAKLAKVYSDRTINLLDGKIISDSSIEGNGKSDIAKTFISKRSSMNYLTSLKLSFKNLTTKRLRSMLVSFACSIGIIGVALVLAISTGFTNHMNKLEANTLASYPLQVEDGPTLGELLTDDFVSDIVKDLFTDERILSSIFRGRPLYPEYPDIKEVYINSSTMNINIHNNKITQDYIDYIEAMDTSLYNSISYISYVKMNLMTRKNNVPIELDTKDIGWQEIISNEDFLNAQYDVLEGRLPNAMNELVLVIDSYNRLDLNIAKSLGFNTEDVETLAFSAFINKEIKLIPNNVYYRYDEDSGLFDKRLPQYAYLFAENIPLKIVGVIRSSEESGGGIMGQGIAYTSALMEYVMNNSASSDIAIAQQVQPNIDIFTGLSMNSSESRDRLRELGLDSTPRRIRIYPASLSSKDEIKLYLDRYNEGKSKGNMIFYIDISQIATSTMSSLIDAITYVFIAFAGISLVVSSIMIGIVTYISVLERTKEIGILRSLGARKRDIVRVFNAETLIIGFVAGILGVIISYLLSIPINLLIARYAISFSNVASLKITHALILILVSMTLTLIAGLVPAKMAARKDPVEALRTE